MRTEAPYEELRPLLFSIAYRMVSSVSEAEDIVQEAFLRIHRVEAEGTRVDSPKAYLSAVVTRLSIDHLKSARARREQYVGQWLPEPLPTDSAPDAAAQAETADSLSMAFLVLLESLTPVERAVFLLREVFGYEYAEIAGIVGKSEANCRQISRRARASVAARRPRFERSPEQGERLMKEFLEASAAGDMDGLLAVLSDDVTLWSDGGGKTRARRATRSTARPTWHASSSERSRRPRPASRSGRPGSTAAPAWWATSSTAGPRARRPSGSLGVGSRRSGSW